MLKSNLELRSLNDNPINDESPVFFAVGKPIDLYETKYTGIGFSEKDYFFPMAVESYEEAKNIRSEDIVASLMGSELLHLFSTFEAAQHYSYFISHQKYDKGRYENTTKAPVFVVSIEVNAQLTKISKQMSDRWFLEGFASASEPTTKTVERYETSIKNLKKIHFSKLYESDFQFFSIQPKPITKEKLVAEFTQIWDKVIDNENLKDLDKLALKCVAVLFKTYPKLNRKQHTNRANEIIGYTQRLLYPPLDKLHNFLCSKRAEANEIPGINKQGHYFKMLEFSISNIEDFMKIKNLKGIENYLTPKM